MISGEYIVSPGVGIFLPYSPVRLPNGQCRIGTLIRLGETIPVVVSDFDGRVEYLVSPGTPVCAGTPVARRIAAVNSVPDAGMPSADTPHATIVSPADGFLTCCDDAGIPFVKAGTVLTPGAIVAVVEFMKIRMDIAYDGPESAVFLHYTDETRRSVRRGEPVAEITKCGFKGE